MALARARPRDQIWALVDFENDSARTAVEVLHAFREHGFTLAGVRLDTAKNVVDQAVARAGSNLPGVNTLLVKLVRQALDAARGQEVQICVSGGFDPERIREFERERAAVNVYAIGESALRGSFPFTSDIAGYYDGETFVRCAKVGREYWPNLRLQPLK